MNETAPLLPWVEVNQGLLSVLALALALGVALWEHIRAERATTRNARALELTADLYLLHAMQELDDAILGQHESPAASARNLVGFSEALKSVAPGAPPHLSIHLIKEAIALCDAASAMTAGSKANQAESKKALGELRAVFDQTKDDIKKYGGAGPLFVAMRGRNARGRSGTF